MTATRSRSRSSSAALVAPLALAAALLTGCGEEGSTTASDPAASATASATASDTPSETTSAAPSESPAADGPSCAEVWIDGETLPGGYDGCYQDGRRVEPDGRYCEFGKPLYTHEGRFWSVPGGRISEVSGELREDLGYRDALAKCSA